MGTRAGRAALALLMCVLLMPFFPWPDRRHTWDRPAAVIRSFSPTTTSGIPPGSWGRAKTDYPLLGHYASSDPAVVREHIRAARAAGIEGFIVSWKHEPRLDEPLAVLVEEARAAEFKLVLLYQGLDFEEEPA